MKITNLDWTSVPIKGAGGDFTGLAAFEECSTYQVVSDKSHKKKKSKVNLKRKLDVPLSKKSVKKTKKDLNGSSFEIEDLDEKVKLTPTKVVKKTNLKKSKIKKGKKKQKDKKSEQAKNEKKIKKEEKVRKNDDKVDSKLSLDNMEAWSTFGIPEPILQSLAEQGFSHPTKIQELTLPSAMLGKRDILGAAETGSGKTLAFGIPILTGILNIKKYGQNYNTKNKRNIKKQPENLQKTMQEKDAENKIVNINKLTTEERKKLLEKTKKLKLKKKALKSKMQNVDSDDEDDDISDSETDVDDDDNEKESDEEDSNDEMRIDDEGSDNEIELDEEDSDNEIELDEEDSDNEIELDEDDDDDDNDDSDSDDNNDNDNEDENDSDDYENENDIENSDIENMDEKEKPIKSKRNSKTSASINEEEMGCVKVLDNLPSNIGPFVNTNNSDNLKPLYALILTPTRELAIQVKNHLVAAAKHTDIKIAVVLGGMAQVKQERILSKGPEIVVATPGRLWELIQIGNDHLSQFADIRFLAIDETDRMIERGHFEELHHILERLNDDVEKKQKRQNFVFSATLTMVHDLPKYLKGKKVTKKGKIINRKVQKLTSDQKIKQLINILGIMDPKVVDVTTKNQGTSETLVECKIICSIDHKDYYLYYVLKRHPGRTIVFCNSIGCVKRLAQLFGILNCKPLPIHASMQQRQRLKNLDRFRDDPEGVLIATDVAARGLDIPNVDHVIHYQVPRTAENYVHRSGRTARANKEGITILLIEPGEAQNYTKICRTLSKTEELPNFPIPDAHLAATRQRVDLARELDQIELKTRKTNSEVGWYEKAIEEMDIILDEKEMPRKFNKEEADNLKNSLKIKKKQLMSLLKKPLFPKGFSFKFPSSSHAIDDVLKSEDTQNALDVMKSSLTSGSDKKWKKSSKNEAILRLETDLLKNLSNKGIQSNELPALKKMNKNKRKKLKRKLGNVKNV